MAKTLQAIHSQNTRAAAGLTLGLQCQVGLTGIKVIHRLKIWKLGDDQAARLVVSFVHPELTPSSEVTRTDRLEQGGYCALVKQVLFYIVDIKIQYRVGSHAGFPHGLLIGQTLRQRPKKCIVLCQEMERAAPGALRQPGAACKAGATA